LAECSRSLALPRHERVVHFYRIDRAHRNAGHADYAVRLSHRVRLIGIARTFILSVLLWIQGPFEQSDRTDGKARRINYTVIPVSQSWTSALLFMSFLSLPRSLFVFGLLRKLLGSAAVEASALLTAVRRLWRFSALESSRNASGFFCRDSTCAWRLSGNDFAADKERQNGRGCVLGVYSAGWPF